jgi:hypothetical protein
LVEFAKGLNCDGAISEMDRGLYHLEKEHILINIVLLTVRQEKS